MIRIFFFAALVSGCGLGVHGYSASYTMPTSGTLPAQNWEESSAEISAPVSSMDAFTCDPSFQLGLHNRSREHDAVVKIHQIFSDGTVNTSLEVEIPRGGTRIMCLPDVGEYDLEIGLFAISHGEPHPVGCYTAHQSYSAFVGVSGRHEYNVDDFSARGGRC